MAISGPVRLTGFSGTLDTDSLIAKMMQAERLPLNKIQKQKQFTIWQREDYQAMNTSLLNFRNTANKLRYESNFEKTAATSSNTAVLDITSSGTTAGSSSVKVEQLATSATLISGSVATDTEKVNKSGTVKINGIEISFAEESTVNSILKDINARASQTGVKASYDKSSGTIYLNSTASGLQSKIEITSDSTTHPNSLSDFMGILKLPSATASGQDAKYTVNGSAVITSASNNVSVNGVQVTLKSTGSASIGTVTDRSGIIDDIKKFVDQYNSLIDTFSTATTTRRSRGYEPLTSEEKEAMTESQITQWEKKARQGTLYNDNILTGTLNTLRTALNTPLDVPQGQIQMLANIGITVKSDYKENGKLEIDETKLREAINTNFEEVKQLFVMTSSEDPAPGKSNLGIADRVYDIVNKQMDALKKKIGSGSIESIDDSVIGKQLKTLNDQEASWKSKLIDIENRYYKKFAAMEQALQKMNSQSSWLASQLG